MSGPTAAQENLQNEQAQFYAQGVQQATTTFGEQQQLLAQIKSVYDPILAKGPNQEGFSESELQDLNAGAVEGTARNYTNAAKATNEALAARGGGNSGLTSGGEDQLAEEVGSSSAEEESNEEAQIRKADYDQGYSEFQQATSAEEDVSGQYNPIGESGAATGAGSAEEKTNSDIASESNSWVNAAIGAAGSLGAAGIGKIP